MPINRAGQRVTAILLAAVAVTVASDGAQALGAQPVTHTRGNPSAVPPILPPPPRSVLAEIRRAEAQEARAFRYHLPPTAKYSNVELNVFASQGYGGS